ncbi:MAG TPA: universal stress protein [Acidimicrobiales bacterium]|nr:universal stress protein [Acidimicrobiales bacterium]
MTAKAPATDPGPGPGPDPTDALRVVVGVDSSDSSKRALRWAARHAELIGAPLEVVHCWHLADEHAWIQPLPPPADPTGIAQQAIDDMVHEAVRPDQVVSVKTLVVEGHAAKTLVEMVDANTILVVGDRGFGGIDGLLIGSTSRQCTAHAPCTVVVVRS